MDLDKFTVTECTVVSFCLFLSLWLLADHLQGHSHTCFQTIPQSLAIPSPQNAQHAWKVASSKLIYIHVSACALVRVKTSNYSCKSTLTERRLRHKSMNRHRTYTCRFVHTEVYLRVDVYMVHIHYQMCVCILYICVCVFLSTIIYIYTHT